jgi:hypothetical protein
MHTGGNMVLSPRLQSSSGRAFFLTLDAEFLRKSILLDFGVDAPHVPESFYHKF